MDEDFAVSDNIRRSPKIADLCSATSGLSLHEKHLPNKTGDSHQSKAKDDVFDNTGKIKEVEKPVLQAEDKCKVVDKPGDAGGRSVISGPIGTQKELDDHKGTLVSGGSADGDDCAEVLGHDEAAAVPPKEPNGGKGPAPVPDVSAVEDLCSEEPENDKAIAGPPKEPDDEKGGALASDGTAVDCHYAEVLENDETTAEPPKEVDVDKGAAPVSQGTAIEDLWAEVQEHDEAKTGPLKEADEGNGAAPVPDGTSVEDLCTKVLDQYEATAAPPKEVDEDKGAAAIPDGTAVEDLCAEVLLRNEATMGAPKEVDEDKGAEPVPDGTAVEDLCAEGLEHDEATAEPPNELDEEKGAAPVPDGTAVEYFFAEVPEDDVTIAGPPHKPHGDEAIDGAYPSPVPLRAAERQQSQRQDLQTGDQPGSVSDLVPGKHDQRSHYSGFITHITEEEFANAPKYAKGTLSLDVVENLVDAFNEALARKYRLLAVPKSQVPKLQRGRVAAYREQETAETEHLRFLVESDLTGMGGVFASRRTAASFFLLMRHCGKMREIRGPGRIVRYAVQ